MINLLAIYGIRDDLYVRVVKNSANGFGLEFEVNVDFLNLVPQSSEIRITNLFLPFIARSKEEAVGLKINFNTVNLIFNAICDPGMCKKAVEVAINLLKDNPGVPVINHPEKLYRVQRDEMYRILHGVDSLYVPKTVKIQPESFKSIVNFVKEEKIFPFIFREVGRHTNTKAELIREERDLHKLEKYPFLGQEYYLTEFVDYRSGDGLYRKYRVVVIDGIMYPRHMIVSDSWNIHAGEREKLMDREEIYREEEKKWLENFSEERVLPIKKIFEKLELEYFAVDFGYLNDGSMVLFEASPCFRYRTTAIDKIKPQYAYHRDYILAIENAILDMIRKKSASRV